MSGYKRIVNKQSRRFISDEHSTVGDSLIQAWASEENFGKNGVTDDDGTNFRGQQRKT